MSKIDKRALREAAEKASTDNHTQDEWFHYLRCSTPEIVLALLDELEAAEKRISELEAREVKLPERYEVDMCPTPSPNGEWFSREDVLAALVSADLSYAAGNGKGE
ncbi:TPA: ead/Ea22-like family protein [Enterobacter hormaechei subsp. xiangfangensis]|uniref:ead/Ea22-like family protein n=1 Tax=Enterobacter hormaechei TaxID=158836 RepID=UPI001FF44BA1|nr:ead/Ea22-like family protein [Enterobacter hormaechei]MCK1000697.1 ead/Ea22-like family protein [Enterobacter hormaechei subsp. xiangfangensis]